MINNKNVYFLVKEYSEECLIKNTRKNIDINNSITNMKILKLNAFKLWMKVMFTSANYLKIK